MKKWLNSIDDFMAVVAISVVSALTIINVFCRFVLSQPIAWVEEVTLGFFVWLVFIGMSSAMKRGGHIGVDYFILKLPAPAQKVVILIRAAAIYFVLVYIFIYLGMELTNQAASKITPVLGISYQLIDIAIPLGGLLAAVHFTVQLVRSLKGESKQLEHNEVMDQMEISEKERA